MQMKLSIAVSMPDNDPEAYISPVLAELREFGDDCMSDYAVAAIRADHLLVSGATNSQVPMHFVFDCDEWEFLYGLLYDEDDEIACVPEPVGSIIVIYRTLFAPCLKKHKALALHLFTSYFENDTLFVLYNPEGISERDLARAGFDELEHDLNQPRMYVRHAAYVTPIARSGKAFNALIDATQADEDWLKSEMQKGNFNRAES